jgi:hypothetical protein
VALLRSRLFPSIAALVCVAVRLLANGGQASEYELKAAFLYKFASFVEWPAPVAGPLTICVFGNDPFGPTLERVVKDKSINGRLFSIRRPKAIHDGSECQILFIASSERPRFKSILGGLNGAILTVGDTPGFCQSGGVINLEVVDERVHFGINPDAAERARLRLSSKLLSLATIVHAEE